MRFVRGERSRREVPKGLAVPWLGPPQAGPRCCRDGWNAGAAVSSSEESIGGGDGGTAAPAPRSRRGNDHLWPSSARAAGRSPLRHRACSPALPTWGGGSFVVKNLL